MKQKPVLYVKPSSNIFIIVPYIVDTIEYWYNTVETNTKYTKETGQCRPYQVPMGIQRMCHL